MRRKVAALLALSILVLGSCSLEPILEDDPAAPSPDPTVHLDQSDRPPPPSELADVVDEVLPSVVNVRVQTAAGRGQGSGVIIERDGIILTNAHVVSEAEDVRVVFNDDVHDPMAGEIVGAVPDRDLAVVRVEADDLTPIELGRSSLLRLGDPVIAVGFPLGLGATVTQGIISGEERTISTGDEGPRLRDLLQTDAAINPGNSGGALVNLSGDLVGINTATASAAFAENTGFAISIDSAVPFIEQILSGREQGFIGVGLARADEFEAAVEEFGYEEEVEGALVLSIQPDSPADDADLEEGMMIVAIDDRPVTSAADLTEIVTEHQPGDTVELALLTPEGDEFSIPIELAARPRETLSPED